MYLQDTLDGNRSYTHPDSAHASDPLLLLPYCTVQVHIATDKGMRPNPTAHQVCRSDIHIFQLPELDAIPTTPPPTSSVFSGFFFLVVGLAPLDMLR
jgi:hypothetical protein